jgi:hypothetical protein
MNFSVFDEDDHDPKELEPLANAYERWYDRDPALSRAFKSLQQAPGSIQAQIALNLIKIIIEHQMELETGITAEDVQRLVSETGASPAENRLRRE